jgi:hypothetical protein
MINPENTPGKLTVDQENDLDRVANSLGGDYRRAYEILKFPSPYENKPDKSHPSIKLADRAILLARAQTLYLKASKVDGFTRKLDSEFDDQPKADTIYHNNKPYNLGDVARISTGGSRHRRAADSMFHKAFGVSEMIEAGVNPNLADDMAQTKANDFDKKNTGPANEDIRKINKKIWKNQANQ